MDYIWYFWQDFVSQLRGVDLLSNVAFTVRSHDSFNNTVALVRRLRQWQFEFPARRQSAVRYDNNHGVPLGLWYLLPASKSETVCSTSKQNPGRGLVGRPLCNSSLTGIYKKLYVFRMVSFSRVRWWRIYEHFRGLFSV